MVAPRQALMGWGSFDAGGSNSHDKAMLEAWYKELKISWKK
jgi:hypothetical protein